MAGLPRRGDATGDAKGKMMSLGRVLRRSLFVAIILGGGGVAAAYPNALRSYYLDLYPTDPGKRQALEMCFLQDHKFNRLDADERENCYRHALLPTQAVAGTSAVDQAQANAIDLRRAAAEGTLPRNDVRRSERTDSALHLQQ
jgi:hypothetical protein